MTNPITGQPIGTGAASAETAKDAKLKNACKQFEGQFFNMMLQEMRKTVPEDPLLGDDSHQQEIFQGMMDEHVAQSMAEHGGPNDLAANMYRQLAHLNAPQSTVNNGAISILKTSATTLKTSREKPDNDDE